MNELEMTFFEDFVGYVNGLECDLCIALEIEPQVVIGVYQVDFLVAGEFVIEIDGHESHKTKEQREHDYKRERYLQKKGYTVIRYMGTEVFLDSKGCAREAAKMIDDILVKRDYENATSCMAYHDRVMQREAERVAKQNTQGLDLHKR